MVYKLTKTDLQPLVDKVADKLPLWKSKLLAKARRTTLTKNTLTAMPIHVSIAVSLSSWTIKAIEKICKAFIWNATEVVSGGRCLIAWSKVTRPIELGGLGVLDLTTFSYALRLRWQWLCKTHRTRSYINLPDKAERVVQAMFSISTMAEVGNGARTLFCMDMWIGGRSIEQIAPLVFAAIGSRAKKTQLVSEALHNSAWARKITGSLAAPTIMEFLQLWDTMQGTTLNSSAEDKFIWRWSSNQQYSASSAYQAFFTGQCSIPGAKELSKYRAPPRCKFFF